MQQKHGAIFVSSSRDMAEWAALTIVYVRDFAARYGLTDLNVLDYRDIDPANVDHAASWQDSVPSRLDVALTIVLLGERLGTPLPASFRLMDDIRERLIRGGYDWVHVPGIGASPSKPGQVPLTGVLFEYFDAFLPRLDGSRSGPLRVIFKGHFDGTGEPDFGNGEFRAQIEASESTAQQKRQLRKDYDQQLDWMNLFWSKIYGQSQYASLFCQELNAFLEQLERALSAAFFADDSIVKISAQRRIDPLKIALPGPAPYDLERALFFLGRGPQIAELTRRALHHDVTRRIVPVSGESGTGKSSLLRAGLLNDALSPARRRLGWRVGFISLAERPHDQSPLLFLAEALVGPSALPELGSPEAIRQRLDGRMALEAARRLLDILATIEISRFPGLGRPKLLLIVDQLELALDGARLEDSESASTWKTFLHVLAALGDALLEPEVRDVLEAPSVKVASLIPTTVVVGLTADRFPILTAVMRPGDHVFPLPRLVDETALREVVTGTFAALGLTIETAARESLCREAIQLAIGTEASILPVLAVTLTALHDDWKQRCDLEAKWRAYADDDAEVPLGLAVMGVVRRGSSRFDIGLEQVKQHGRLDKAIARLGELAWDEAEAEEEGMKLSLRRLPLSTLQMKAQSGEITARDLALARLLRRLVSVSAQETVPDRLMGLPDSALDEVERPLAEALRKHRLLTRHDDGTWWLVHLAVLQGWPRATEWRAAELQIFRTIAAMDMDRRRWQEESSDGEPDAARWLWTREGQVERAIDWMAMRGPDENPELTAFAKEGTVGAVRRDPACAGRILRAAAWFNDSAWATRVLDAAGTEASVACNQINKDGNGSALRSACYAGNLEIVRLLLQEGANPNLLFLDGSGVLDVAAYYGNDAIVEVLLAAGAAADRANNEGWTPLIIAAHGGYDVIASRLLMAGAEVNHATNDGVTPLTVAAENGHVATVLRLVAAKATVDQPNNQGWTALMHAARSGHGGVVAELLAAGADVNHSANSGTTALIASASNGHDAVIVQLLGAGAYVNHATESVAITVPMAADEGARNESPNRLSRSPEEFSSFDADHADNDGLTALTEAARHGHGAAVARLLTAGANVNQADKNGATALFYAAENGHIYVVTQLLQDGADVNYTAKNGTTALIYATGYGKATDKDYEQVITALLVAGAKVDGLDEDGQTALQRTVRRGEISALVRLLDAGSDIDHADKQGFTALMFAAKSRNEAAARLLINRGAGLLLRNGNGLSALEIAYIQEAKPIVDLILATGVSNLSKAELEVARAKPLGMNIGLVVNARGKVCMVHDTKFKGVPIWVGYNVDSKHLEIFFETGTSFSIGWEATDEMHNFLLKISKILIIRMENRRPVEGYDTSFLHLKDGKIIDQ